MNLLVYRINPTALRPEKGLGTSHPFRTWAGDPLSAANCFSTNPFCWGSLAEATWKEGIFRLLAGMRTNLGSLGAQTIFCR